MQEEVLAAYGLDQKNVSVESFGTGLINHTWKVTDGADEYILQNINQFVFKEPEGIAENIQQVADYLKEHHPNYFFAAPIHTSSAKTMFKTTDGDYFRLFPFVKGSHAKQVVETAEQAKEAAIQFGRFTKLLSNFPVDKLNITIQSFHHLSYRYKQFLLSLVKGNDKRKRAADTLIVAAKKHSSIVEQYEKILTDLEFKLRVTHHDTKISNVLFNQNEKSICIIDLDTLMPGYFFSDVGDMMRTYLCPVSEEETDLAKIVIRKDVYEAIVSGYYEEMKDELTETEKKHFFYAGEFAIYMQAIRFLTDYLNDDVYYGSKYPAHNFQRAANQFKLLEKFQEMRSVGS
ncbi:MAG: aminoglycoside phosphotransferase [Chitinophagaceae bacterium]|nr:aminoglycoside phosphotransferase [Chitinophagaceae bacterium]